MCLKPFFHISKIKMKTNKNRLDIGCFISDKLRIYTCVHLFMTLNVQIFSQIENLRYYNSTDNDHFLKHLAHPSQQPKTKSQFQIKTYLPITAAADA